jgi:hypothetical protein
VFRAFLPALDQGGMGGSSEYHQGLARRFYAACPAPLDWISKKITDFVSDWARSDVERRAPAAFAVRDLLALFRRLVVVYFPGFKRQKKTL